MAQNITLMGASYSAVPAVTLPKTGGGTATFTDTSDATLDSNAKMLSGVTAYANGTKYTGSIGNGSATPASSITGTTATVSSPSSNKIMLTQTVSNTPQVSAGYISSGTAGNSSVSLTGACTTKGTTSYYASTSDQTIGAGTYITGTQTFKAVSQTNLSAENIKNGTTISISNGNGNIWSVTGTYDGGGGGSVQMDSVGAEGSATSTLSISGLYGEPTSFALVLDNNGLTPSSTPQVDSLVYDGTNLHGQTITNTTNAQVSYDSAFSKSYSNGTLTITSTNAIFVNDAYIFNYSYGGTSACINTADVQVGSGATSITFTDLEDEPIYWSCIFKSNFSTSSGYQRVIFVQGGADISAYGHCMDSTTKDSGSWWTPSYNNGSLTITSQGTNAGGYFHQPGYYQLTYAIADASPYEKKSATYRASTSAQTDKIEPSSGYDAMSEVNITIPAVTQTNLTADNIKSGTTVSISNGQSNLWSITGTYGGGGDSKNVQVLQSTSRTSSSSLTKVLGDLTVSKTGTYDIYWSGGRTNTSTSYTWGTRLYVDGTGYGTENTTWTNNCQSNHLSNVSLTANQKLSVYARGRTGSYYTFAPMLVIIEA